MISGSYPEIMDHSIELNETGNPHQVFGKVQFKVSDRYILPILKSDLRAFTVRKISTVKPGDKVLTDSEQSGSSELF